VAEPHGPRTRPSGSRFHHVADPALDDLSMMLGFVEPGRVRLLPEPEILHHLRQHGSAPAPGLECSRMRVSTAGFSSVSRTKGWMKARSPTDSRASGKPVGDRVLGRERAGIRPLLEGVGVTDGHLSSARCTIGAVSIRRRPRLTSAVHPRSDLLAFLAILVRAAFRRLAMRLRAILSGSSSISFGSQPSRYSATSPWSGCPGSARASSML
jgi:hypothetical protein